MENAAAYIPEDRRRSLAGNVALPEQTTGAALFADISGFTPLTDALVREFGARRGAEQLTRHLNAVYSALIAQVHAYGGSVIGFSGDGIVCWFSAEAAQATLRATASALAMQQAMQPFYTLQLSATTTVNLAIKTAVAAGPTRRMIVGDPNIQLIDVLAGATVDRMAASEQMAQKHEVLLDAQTIALVADQLTLRAWRIHAASGYRVGVVESLRAPVPPLAQTVIQAEPSPAQVRPWVLPAIYTRVQNDQGRFLAELRPATALFLKFSGLDFEADTGAAEKLNAFITWVQRVINRYEGTLIQLTTGDKGSYLYAAFGAPVAHDDDSCRAVAAALELRTQPPALNFVTSLQTGLSQGMMRVGAYGSPLRLTYGVLGEETAIAARLMTHATPGQILVTQVVAEAVTEDFQVTELGLVQLKGRTEPQLLFVVNGRKAGERLKSMLKVVG